MGKSSTSFKKGNPGRKPGTTNKLTRAVRDTVLETFNHLQADPKVNLLAWGKENPKEFYQIAAKLIPTELTADVNVTKLRNWAVQKASEAEDDSQ